MILPPKLHRVVVLEMPRTINLQVVLPSDFDDLDEEAQEDELCHALHSRFDLLITWAENYKLATPRAE